LECSNGLVEGFYDSLISRKVIVMDKGANRGSKIGVVENFELNSG
jgi:hypothetical protein